MTQAAVLSATGIRKQFFGVEVLHDISLEVRAGTVHGLVGENGAGKSTLMKIIAGVHRRDGGEVRIDGQVVDFSHPVEAGQGRRGHGLPGIQSAARPHRGAERVLRQGTPTPWPRRCGHDASQDADPAR